MEVIYSGDGYYSNATANKTFKVNKLSTKLLANGITAVFNVNKDLVISLNDANGDAVIGGFADESIVDDFVKQIVDGGSRTCNVI